MVNTSKNNWDTCLTSTLWANHMTFIVTMGFTPFNLIYGTQALLPKECIIPTFNWLTPKYYAPERLLITRVNDLHWLHEWWNLLTCTHLTILQKHTVYWHKKHNLKQFEKGDTILCAFKSTKSNQTTSIAFGKDLIVSSSLFHTTWPC